MKSQNQVLNEKTRVKLAKSLLRETLITIELLGVNLSISRDSKLVGDEEHVAEVEDFELGTEGMVCFSEPFGEGGMRWEELTFDAIDAESAISALGNVQKTCICTMVSIWNGLDILNEC